MSKSVIYTSKIALIKTLLCDYEEVAFTYRFLEEISKRYDGSELLIACALLRGDRFDINKIKSDLKSLLVKFNGENNQLNKETRARID